MIFSYNLNARITRSELLLDAEPPNAPVLANVTKRNCSCAATWRGRVAELRVHGEEPGREEQEGGDVRGASRLKFGHLLIDRLIWPVC